MRGRGYSILEAVVAVNLAALLIVFLMGIIPYSIVSFKRSGHSLVAANLAENLMENIRMMPFASIPIGTFTPASLPPSPGFSQHPTLSTAVTVQNDGNADTRLYDFSVIIAGGQAPYGSPPDPIPDIRIVTITVTWVERVGVTGGNATRAFQISSEILRQTGN